MDWTLLLQLTLNGLIVGALYGVVAMSFVLIYKASQVVNFAQGEFLLVGAWVCWWFLTEWQLPFWLGFLFTLAFMTVFGIVLQVVVLRPLTAGVRSTTSKSLKVRLLNPWLVSKRSLSFQVSVIWLLALTEAEAPEKKKLLPLSATIRP